MPMLEHKKPPNQAMHEKKRLARETTIEEANEIGKSGE